MADPSPEELVEAVRNSFPDTSREGRPVHAIGISATGYFEASEVARNFCVAEHFGGPKVDVTVRFSNGSGSVEQHDGWSDVRGMATRFHLANAAATDLIAMTLGEFFVADLKSFMDMLAEGKIVEAERESPWSKIFDLLSLRQPLPDPRPGERVSGQAGLLRFAQAHGCAQLGILDAGAIGAPTSYARATYHAVHTFVVTAPGGEKRHVRFSWQPVAGVRKVDPDLPPRDKYLHGELRDRVNPKNPPTRFMLMMAIGEHRDAFDDPTRPWPLKRQRVSMGTLFLTETPKDQSETCERMSFNPCRLTPGIDVSDDPILRARKEVYKVSSRLRGATACPFAGE